MMKFPGSKFESQPKSRELIIMHKLEERIASRRDVVNLEVEACQLSPNLSLKYSCNHLHRQHNFATFIFVQFNLLLFQFKDANHHCLLPMMEATKSIQTFQDDPEEIQAVVPGSKMTHDGSEFCQEPPKSSGRWECPAIRRSVHINPRCQQTSADPRHVLPQQQDQPNSSVLLRQ